ncbi:BQ2448_3196 [Microbotryum intermedium]|uniref:BQ2448_3196 protein n=1 Tax=Microbotryum intermedium TaxID=269621 RepID=A0A238FKB2_9BASI|nr:BQ2448_3196 [Microbotryum intermedium]
MAHAAASHSLASAPALATISEQAQAQPLHVTRGAARRAGFRVTTPKSISTMSRSSSSRSNISGSGSSDLSKPTISSLSRQRATNNSTANAAAAATVKAGATSFSSKRRSVLGEAKNVTISSSSSSRSLASLSTPHRKVGRVEAAQMTGMGVIRVGPAVQAQRSPKKFATHHDSGSTSNPYSVAFVAPHFDRSPRPAAEDENAQPRQHFGLPPSSMSRSPYSTSPEKRVISQLPSSWNLSSTDSTTALSARLGPSPAPSVNRTTPLKIGTMSPNKELAQSPARRRLFGAFEANSSALPLELSPPVRQASVEASSAPIHPSSPLPHAQTPRALTESSNRKHSAASDESDDEIDWLSPRKKPRPSFPTSSTRAESSQGHSQLPPPPSPGQLRTPPKKSSSSSESTITSASTPRAMPSPSGLSRPMLPTSVSMPMLATPRSTATSVPMVRSPCIRFPPSPFSTRPPPTAIEVSTPSLAVAMTPARPSQTATPKVMPAPSIMLSMSEALDPHVLEPIASSSTPFGPPWSPSSLSLAPRPCPSKPPMPSPAHTRSYKQRKQNLLTTQAQPHGQSYLVPSGIPRMVPSPSKPLITFSAPIPPPSPLFEPLDIPTTIDPACLLAQPCDVDTADGDISTSSTSSTSTLASAGDTSSLSSSGNRSMSEETSKRLANLQSMLSRLSTPRPPAASTEDASNRLAGEGARAPPSNLADLQARRERTKALTAHYREEYTVPIAPPAGETSSRRTASRNGGPPVKEQQAGGIGMGAPPMRRNNGAAMRGANGIIDTSSRGGPLQSTSSAPSVMEGTTTTVKQSRHVSGGPIASSASTATIAAAAVGDGEMCAKPKNNVLRGVVAFVDVRTLEGDDAGMIFTDMLKSMGARVTTRPTLSLTHIVYKSGRSGTLQRYRTHADPKPHLVGISWVVRCAELNQHVEEKPFLIEAGKEDMFQKKRRSMEPKALSALNAPPGVLTAATNPGLKATIAASLERARRQSLQFAPKVGSPLAKRVFVMQFEESTEEDAEGPDEA